MKKHYDVIIIGAGPAGLKCAEQLKESDLSVLLVEKNKTIVSKACAGCLSFLVKDSDIPLNKSRKFPDYKVITPSRIHKISFLPSYFRTIERRDLGQYQLSKIHDAFNIDVLFNTFTQSINHNKIVTNRGEFSCKYLVGADGSFSRVRQYLGLKTKVYKGLYYTIETHTSDFSIYLDSAIVTYGYLWIFPHNTHTNVGIYFNPQFLTPKRAKEILKHFLAKRGYTFSDNNFRGGLINTLYQGCLFDTIFLIGDAAGLASRATGEGISFAMISGQEIAKKILNPHYKMKELKRVLILKRIEELLLQMFYFLPTSYQFFFLYPNAYKFFYKLFGKIMNIRTEPGHLSRF